MTYRVWIVAGTRPEVVKLAPVYRALRAHTSLAVTWVSTGQHTSLAEQAYRGFEIVPDLTLNLQRKGSAAASVADLLGRMILALDEAMIAEAPHLVVVQGDTTSAVAACLAAFGNKIPVAHVEAGLRTYDLASPYPEEAWRTLIGKCADLHFAPTQRAADNLLRDGVVPEKLLVTGNTVIDALRWLAGDRLPSLRGRNERRSVLITTHRRENWNGALERICEAVLQLAGRFNDIDFEFVAHANPALRRFVDERLAGPSNVRVLDPMDYEKFVGCMRRACLIMSDSGGVQEEAPAFGVPVLVLRDITERPEAVEAGVARLVGTDCVRICTVAGELLGNDVALAKMAQVVNPFGDGKAAPRIANRIEAFLVSVNSVSEGCKPAA